MQMINFGGFTFDFPAHLAFDLGKIKGKNCSKSLFIKLVSAVTDAADMSTLFTEPSAQFTTVGQNEGRCFSLSAH